MPLVETAARDLWRKCHTEGNTRKKGKLEGRRDHVWECGHKSIRNEALAGAEQYSDFFLLLLSEELLQRVL